MGSPAKTAEAAICRAFGIVYNKEEGLYTGKPDTYLEGSRVDVIIGGDWVAVDDDAGTRSGSINFVRTKGDKGYWVVEECRLTPAEPVLALLKRTHEALSNVRIGVVRSGEAPETSLEKWYPLADLNKEISNLLEALT